MMKEELKDMVTNCMDIVLAVLLAAAKDKATAMEGVEALHKDMILNVERFYAKEH